MYGQNPRYSRRAFLRRVGAAALMVAGGGIAAACGSSSTGSSANGGSGGKAASSGGTVNFFARGDQAIFKVFHQLNDAFKKREPDISVKIQEVPGDFYQKFQLELASGTPPDCLFECDCTIDSSIRNKALQPLDEYMKGDKRFNRSDYLDIAFYTSVWDNKTYGLPYDGGSLALYYNKELLQSAGLDYPDPQRPMSWNDVLDYGKKLTVDRGGKHPGESGFDPKHIKQYGIDPAQGYWQVWVWGAGGEVITKDGQVPIDEPEAVDGLQFLADLGTKHYIAPSPAFQQSQNLSFLTGNVAMYYGGVWDMVRNRDAKFDWDVAPFPTGKIRVSTGWYSPLSMTAAGKNKDGAWKWISFCCSSDGETIVSQLGQDVPPLKKLAHSKAFLNPKVEPDHKEVFLRELDPKILRVPGDKFGKYWGGYYTEFHDVFDPAFDPVWTGKKSAADAAKAVRPKLEKLLRTGKVSLVSDRRALACACHPTRASRSGGAQ